MKTLKMLYYVTIPLLYIFYIIYARLFLNRPLRPLFVELSLPQIFFTLLAIFFICLRIYFLLKREGIIKEKQNKNYMVLKMKKLLQDFYEHQKLTKIYCYRILLPKTVSFALLVLKWLNFLYKTIPAENRFVVFVFIMEIIPKIVVLCCFLIDIFYFRQFNYFYKALWLLLLPLLLSLLEFLLLQYYADNINPMLGLITSKPHTTPGLEDYDEFCFVNPDGIPDFIHGIDDFIDNHFLPIYQIRTFLLYLMTLKADYYPFKVQLIVNLLYLLGWLTILCFGIQL